MSRRKQARPIRVNENENGYGSASQTILNETKSTLVEAFCHTVRDDEKLLREIGKFYLAFYLKFYLTVDWKSKFIFMNF